MKTTNEVCRILVGYKWRQWRAAHFLNDHYVGSPLSVEFSWKTVFERENTHHDVLGIYHTHPDGDLDPSEKDEKTLTTWSFCLGKSLLAIIDSLNNFGAYHFDQDGYKAMVCIKIFNWFFWKEDKGEQNG